ncbi:MAG TPA: cobalt-precorrin 5A hydrolase [Candidatus Wunengus sp. YC60]|uniref:cobalt-precorrin 5A hydrolase n=1 Tax=Candidatus Wunengus sp. YC60 TaxID=3367697 RepID=UPI004029252C
MNIAIIALTEQGSKTAQRIGTKFSPTPSIYLVDRKTENTSITKDNTPRNIIVFSEPLQQLVNQIFKQYDGLVFVMAMGIVVRVIAPLIHDKHTDPAVVVVDDVGRFVISALSGHEGGANQLAHRIASILHTDAVITTGTDTQKDIIVGIGCKKGISGEIVKNSILDALQRVNRKIEDVRLLSTIDIKAEELGLIQVSKELGIPLRVVSKSEIATCAKEHSKSKFVKEKIGVWGVCEPAALIAGRKTRLILTKQKYPGMTVAIAQENFMW